jgi:hypothetical protein
LGGAGGEVAKPTNHRFGHRFVVSEGNLGVQAMSKVPVCEKCGNTLKGRVPKEARVICYFCSNPPLPEEEETLKYKDIPNGTT